MSFGGVSASYVLGEIRKHFARIEDSRIRRGVSLVDSLMSGLAVFGLKSPSLLHFERLQQENAVSHNIRCLYGVGSVPSDTHMRSVLDEVQPSLVEGALDVLFHASKMSGALYGFKYIDDAYLVSVDGTGLFASTSVHCEQCCVSHHRDGSISYKHMMNSAVLVHPLKKTVLPLACEAIERQASSGKNDCEQAASQRCLIRLRERHPNLKMIILQDSLHAVGPHVELLEGLGMSYILSGKQYKNDLQYGDPNTIESHEVLRDGVRYLFKWRSNTTLNSANPHLLVNLLTCQEIHPKRKPQTFTWVTNLTITQDNVYQLMQGARARWKIENETFNTLKNQGYHFEHNFGHGYKHLCSVFGALMLLAFGVDQLLQEACALFQQALLKTERKAYLWGKVQAYFRTFYIDSWAALWTAIAQDHVRRLSVECDSS